MTSPMLKAMRQWFLDILGYRLSEERWQELQTLILSDPQTVLDAFIAKNVQSYREEVDRKSKEIHRLNGAIRAAFSELENAKRERNASLEEVRRLEASGAVANADMAKLQTEFNDLSEKHTRLCEKLESTYSQKLAAEGERDTLKKAFDEYREDSRASIRQRSDLHNKLDDAMRDLASLRTEKQKLQWRNDELSGEVQRLTKRVDYLVNKYPDDLAKEEDEAQQEVQEAAKAAADVLQEKLDNLWAQKERLKGELENTNSALGFAKAKITELTQIKELQSSHIADLQIILGVKGREHLRKPKSARLPVDGDKFKKNLYVISAVLEAALPDADPKRVEQIAVDILKQLDRENAGEIDNFESKAFKLCAYHNTLWRIAYGPDSGDGPKKAKRILEIWGSPLSEGAEGPVDRKKFLDTAVDLFKQARGDGDPIPLAGTLAYVFEEFGIIST